jgi:Tfp pilus assembly PilM family ATPase
VRSLIPSEISPEETSLIVDIGAGRTSFIITEGVIPYFTSSIPFSSEMISDAIAGNFNIDKKNAEQIKINEGIERSSDGGSVFNAVKALLETLASEIEKTMDFYQNISKESSGINKIIMCGGGSNLRGIVPYLTTRLSREIMVGDPWVNLHLGNKLPIIDKESSVRYATAIGLALKKIDYGDQY